MRLWVLCFLVFCAGSSLAQHDGLEYYDGMYEGPIPAENEDDAKVDLKHQDDDSKNYGKANKDLENAEDRYDTLDDYQFEDNRSSESNDKQNIEEEATKPVDSKTYDKDIEEKDASHEENPEKDGIEAKIIIENPKKPADSEDIEEKDAEYEENAESDNFEANDNVEELTEPVDSQAHDDDIEDEDTGYEENPENVDSDANDNVEEPTEPVDFPSDYERSEDNDAGHEENPESVDSDANDNVEEPIGPVESAPNDDDIEYEDTGLEENSENVVSDATDNVKEPTWPVESPPNDDDIEYEDTGLEENSENVDSDANDNVEEPPETVDFPANYEGSKDNDASHEENPESVDSDANDNVEVPTGPVDYPAHDESGEDNDVDPDKNPENDGSEHDDNVEEPTEPVDSSADNEGSEDSNAGHKENPENDGFEAIRHSLFFDEDTENKDGSHKENTAYYGFKAGDDQNLTLGDNNQADDYKNTESINLSDVINRLQEEMDQYEDVERSQEQHNSDEEQVKDSNINDGEDNEDKQLNDMVQNIDYNNDRDTQNESDEDTDDDLKKLLETLEKFEDDTDENSYANDDDNDDDNDADDSEMSVNDDDSDNQETDKNTNDSEMDQDRKYDDGDFVAEPVTNTTISEEISGTEVDTALSSTVSSITVENENNEPSPTEYNDYADALQYDSGNKVINQERNEHTNDSDMAQNITDQEDNAILPNLATFLRLNSSQDYDHSTVIPSDDHSTDAPFIPQNIDLETLSVKDSEYSKDKLSDDLSYHSKYAALYSTVSTNTEEDEDYEQSDATPEQYDVLMEKFTTEPSESINSDYFQPLTKSISSPVFVALTDETPHVIESPNYPDHYPTDIVIEYYINAQGSGIELNITDFSVNGNAGDYLLVKPGGVYASDEDAMVISYDLSEKRMYRFVDVDRLYMRFNSGFIPHSGFQLSVRMLYKQEITGPVEPPISLTVALGGRTPLSFGEVQEDFRRLLAAMAQKYVEESDIDPKQMVTDTNRAAQIASTSDCINSVDHEWDGLNCVKVTFHVPVIYGVGGVRFNLTDLSAMWYTYHTQEPYATGLQNMGLTVYVPQPEQKQSRMLTIWLVIGAGVLISAAMLAVALWRFSCYESYTRMPAYSDTDSLTKKRVLDMYPTPHQAFPALYAEQQLTWDDDKFDEATRVDMDGYANIGFAHKLLDMESDDDVKTTPRDKNSIGPSDV